MRIKRVHLREIGLSIYFRYLREKIQNTMETMKLFVNTIEMQYIFRHLTKESNNILI